MLPFAPPAELRYSGACDHSQGATGGYVLRVSGIRWLDDEGHDVALMRRDELDVTSTSMRPARPHLIASRGAVVNMASLDGQLSSRTSPPCPTRRTRPRSSG